MVVGGTIDKYIYICLRRLPGFFKFKSKISYSQVEEVDDNESIQHRAIRDTLKHLAVHDGVELTTMADLPAKCGLGSSSAFLVGLVNAIHELQNKSGSNPSHWDMYLNGSRLYKTVTYLEQEILKENVGFQDTAFASFGGFGRFDWEPGTCKLIGQKYHYRLDEDLECNLLLFHSGVDRITTANDVAGSYVNDLNRQETTINKMIEMAEEGWEALYSGNYDQIGSLLNKSWLLKRSLSPNISTTGIDLIYREAMNAGALGFKSVGAGGGGCVLVYANKDRATAVRSALKGLVEIPFKFSNRGSEIILNA